MADEENLNIAVETLAESDTFTVWRAKEPDGEIQYHIDMDNVTVHFFQDEWDELLEILSQFYEGGARTPKKGGSGKK